MSNSGLLLPRYAVLNQQHSLQSNQGLIDVVCVARGTAIGLEAPAAATQQPLLPGGRERRTHLLGTSLTPAQFGAAVTTGAFRAAFAVGQPYVADSLSTGALAPGNVLAFRTADGYTGLLLVNTLSMGTAPLLNCTVRVQK